MVKKRLKIHFLPRAEDDLDEIITCIYDENISAALKVFETIEDNILKLSDFPYIGKKASNLQIRRLGYRQLIINNYLIFYRIEEENVLICRIIHSARDYEAIFTN